MYCPNCRSEYREGYTECKNCRVNLVDELPIDEEVLKPKRQLPCMKYLRIEYIPILCALAELVNLILILGYSVYSMLIATLPTGRLWMLVNYVTFLPLLTLPVLIVLVFLYRLIGREFAHKRLFYQICLYSYLVLFAYTVVTDAITIPQYIHWMYSAAGREAIEPDRWYDLLAKWSVNTGLMFGSQLSLVLFFFGRLRGWAKGLTVWIVIYSVFALLKIVDWYITNRFGVQSVMAIVGPTAVAFLMFLDKDGIRKKHVVVQEVQPINE